MIFLIFQLTTGELLLKCIIKSNSAVLYRFSMKKIKVTVVFKFHMKKPSTPFFNFSKKRFEFNICDESRTKSTELCQNDFISELQTDWFCE